jgi:hypothetical protein
LNSTTSNQAHFVLGVISQSGKSGWQDEVRESLYIPHSRRNAAICSATQNQNFNKRMSKEDKIRKQEKGKKNEARTVSRVRTDRDRKGYDHYYFPTQKDVSAN